MANNKKLFVEYSTKNIDDIFKEFGSSEQGLSDQEVVLAQKKYGKNQIEERRQTWFWMLVKQFNSPFFYTFLAIAFISLVVGEFYNGIIILSFIVFNALISFFQEFRATKELEKLKQYLIHYVTVVRNNSEIKIKSTDVVPGDIVSFNPGDMVPADIRFIETQNLMIDESALTGESSLVTKNADSISKEPTEIYKAATIGFAGTIVAKGDARGIVFATGKNTTMGEIAYLTLASIRESSFARGIQKIGNFIVVLVIATLAIIFLANLAIKGTQAHIFDLFIFSTALAIAVIPEALPAIVTFCLAQGVAQLAKKKVIVRRLSAIESMGSIEVLCADKTGTLTENTMTVDSVNSPNQIETLFYAVLASEVYYAELPKLEKGFDRALWLALNEQDRQSVFSYKQIKSIPFEAERRRNTVLISYNKDNKDKCTLIMRGMPEEIISRSNNLSQSDIENLKRWEVNEGTKGHRVLAIARKEISCESGKNKNIDNLEENVEFLGSVSFVDPLKKTAPEAIERAKQLGIQIKIISGDSKEVCATVGTKVGLIKSIEDVITGTEFAKKNLDEKRSIVFGHAVFARILPEQKYEIIHLLKERYEVGYMGDGINDAPALKIADVSIAVQGSVDIAREVADIILLKKSLIIIINGIEEGRKIFANTLKYLKTSLSSTFGNFYSLAIVSLFLDYLPMLPIQILLLNILADIPMIAISTDSVDFQDIKSPELNYVKNILIIASILGSVSSVFDFTYFGFFKSYEPEVLRTGWFLLSIGTELIFIFSMRTRRPFYKAKWPSIWLILFSCVALLLSLLLALSPFGHHYLGFAPLTSVQLGLISVIVICYFITTEAVKDIFYYYLRPSQ